jgi:hypothetical protein
MRIRLSGYAALFVVVVVLTAPVAADTGFKYGGYIKLDINHSYYYNGDVGPESPLRDFHFPAAIPVGSDEENYDLDYHVKESRFNFTTLTQLASGREIKGFMEFDFLLSPAGDERVSNSWNPRLRHFYFSTGPWLAGQTWTTLMIVIIPDDLDFAGAAEGIIFGRQPQVRFTRGAWQVALENPETVLSTVEDGTRLVTESSQLPDIIGRRNFGGDWGTGGVAVIARQLHYNDPTSDFNTREFGFGVSGGADIKVGVDDLKFQATAGRGLGRYVGLNFLNAAGVDSVGNMSVIDQIAGFVAYRHFWNERWRSTADVSVYYGDNPSELPGGVNDNAQSVSVNLLYSPDPKLTLGVEYMHARRELKSGVDGQFDRIQFSARYDFGYQSTN